jgi:thiol peroxidase
MTQERTGVVTFGGKPVTLVGPEIQVGDKAPGFELQNTSLAMASMKDYEGKVRLISVVPSLDTGVCDAQTRRFNQEATDFSENIVVLTISADLPFAQKRWCGAADIDRVITLSDHLQMSFGDAWGTHMKELRLESRAVFVVDSVGIVTYVEYLPEVTQHPNYDAAVEAVKKAK